MQICLLFWCLLLGSKETYAQDSLQVTEAPLVLSISDTALLVVGRRDEVARDLPYAIESVSTGDIRRAQSLSTADALANLSGVYVQKSQFGGGSPVLRGFEANRVLLVVDGVRMNNAIYRAGHLQNAITVSPLALDRLEVIYGAGALAYGSDAIGGVVHFRTQQPTFRARTQDAVNGQLSSNFSTAARVFSLAGKLAYGAEHWAGLTIFSTTATSHLRAGAQRPDAFPNFGLRSEYFQGDRLLPNDRPNRQIGTAYQQYDLLQKFRFRLADRLALTANFQFSTSSNIPRYDALTERRDGQLRWARWEYGPQTRLLGALHLQDRRPTLLYDLASYLISHQFIEEDRISRRALDPLEENNFEEVHTTNFQTDFTKTLQDWTFRYGIDFRYDAVASEAFLKNINSPTGLLPPLSTRYPSQGSSLLGGGLYLEAQYPISPRWQLRGGLRYSRQRLAAQFGSEDPIEWPQAYLSGIRNTEGALTSALGLRYQRDRQRWRFLLAQGFRTPNIDDFAKFRERNGRIQIPNPDLIPERSLTAEIGYELGDNSSPFHAQINVYHTWLREAIVRRDGTLPNGQKFFVSRGDTLLVQTNVNAESARVYGIDLMLSWQLSHQWRVRTKAHALRGERKQLSPDEALLTLPQDHIPPPYGSTSVAFSQAPWQLGLRFRYQLAKDYEDYAVNTILGTAATGYTFDRTGTSDNLEFTPFSTEDNRFNGSYGWWTLNTFAEWQSKKLWTIRLKIENVFDRHYRTFASGVSAPGIDVGIGLEKSF